MGLMLFLFGTFIGVTVVSGFMGLVKFTVNKAFGRNVVLFRFINVFYQEGMGFSHIGFSPVCELQMRKEEDTDLSVIVAFVIEMMINVLTCTIYNVFMVKKWINKTADERIIAFFLGIGAWFILFMAVNFICLFVALKRRSSGIEKQLAEIVGKLNDGLPFDDIDVPDHRTLEGKAMQLTVINYLTIAFAKKLWEDDAAGAGDVIMSQERKIKIDYANRPKGYLIRFARAYYDLLYYYSAVCINRNYAEYFYDMLSSQLQSDKDADGRRVLAAYFLYVQDDLRSAEHYAYEAEEAVHSMKTKAEKLLEDKLIKKIISDIYEKKKYDESSRAAL